MKSDFLGRSLEEVEALFKRDGKQYTVTRCFSYKPYENADSSRVLRMKEKNGVCELLVGEFITNVETSQG